MYLRIILPCCVYLDEDPEVPALGMGFLEGKCIDKERSVQQEILCRRVEKLHIDWHISLYSTVFSHYLFNLGFKIKEMLMAREVRGLALPEATGSIPSIHKEVHNCNSSSKASDKLLPPWTPGSCGAQTYMQQNAMHVRLHRSDFLKEVKSGKPREKDLVSSPFIDMMGHILF